ncbi:MAG: hypothetical protein ABFS34_08720 [Gemmatimonadota bacterium]
MDLDTLAKLGEFVGGAFVVVTLIYLAYQVRQNTRTLQSENYARVLDRMSTLQSRLAADAELNRIVVVGAADPAELRRSERLRLSWAMYELFGATEFMYHTAADGALAEEVWTRWSEALAWWLSHPGVQEWWRIKPTPMSASFERHVEGMLERDSLVDPEHEAAWRRFVIGDGPELLSSKPGEPATD